MWEPWCNISKVGSHEPTVSSPYLPYAQMRWGHMPPMPPLRGVYSDGEPPLPCTSWMSHILLHPTPSPGPGFHVPPCLGSTPSPCPCPIHCGGLDLPHHAPSPHTLSCRSCSPRCPAMQPRTGIPCISFPAAPSRFQCCPLARGNPLFPVETQAPGGPSLAGAPPASALICLCSRQLKVRL